MSKYVGPVPLIEEHYHIKELIDRQQKRSDDRTYHREKAKEAEERQKIIDDSQMVVATDFHCDHCNKDFKAMAVLQVEIDWTNERQSIAFYKSKHRACGRWAIRLVTDKQRDGFYIKSRAMRIQQGIYHNDILQPFENGYNLLYGKR